MKQANFESATIGVLNGWALAVADGKQKVDPSLKYTLSMSRSRRLEVE